MAQCINVNCRKTIDDQFAFCPYCGTDNRAPDKRLQPKSHQHQYPAAGPYFCVECGVQQGKATKVNRPANNVVRTIVVSIGCAYLLLILVTWYATFQSSQPRLLGFGDWCRSQKVMDSTQMNQPMTKGGYLLSFLIGTPVVTAMIAMRFRRLRRICRNPIGFRR